MGDLILLALFIFIFGFPILCGKKNDPEMIVHHHYYGPDGKEILEKPEPTPSLPTENRCIALTPVEIAWASILEEETENCIPKEEPLPEVELEHEIPKVNDINFPDWMKK